MIRTSPHPLIPVRRANPRLVGFLLHPISRSETWRRLFTLRTQRSEGSFSRLMHPELLARSSIPGPHLPGGRVDLEDANQRIDNPRIVLDPCRFLKPESNPGAKNK